MALIDQQEAAKLIRQNKDTHEDCQGAIHYNIGCEHSAQIVEQMNGQEIIHCKDCKFAYMTVDGECKYCDIWFPDEKTYMPGDYYCASAERKDEENEQRH